MYQIERNVPPPPHASAPNRPKYPFKEMNVGDSFAVPVADKNSLRSTASAAGFRLGRKFTIRKQDDATLRCWRIE